MDISVLRRGPTVNSSKATQSTSYKKTIPVKRKCAWTYILLLLITIVVAFAFYFLHYHHNQILVSVSPEGQSSSKPRPSLSYEETSYADIDLSYSDEPNIETSGKQSIKRKENKKLRSKKEQISVSSTDNNNKLQQTNKNKSNDNNNHNNDNIKKRNSIDKREMKKREKITGIDAKTQKTQTESVVQPPSSPSPSPHLSAAQEKRMRNSKKQRKFQSDKLLNHEADWGADGREKYIEIMPTKKIMLKKDRRVVFPNLTLPVPSRPPGPPSNQSGLPRALVSANTVLQQHPLLVNPSLANGEMSLDEVMVRLQAQTSCRAKPIFLTMATVGDELYWQLVENFVYSMVKFGLSQCAVVICVSDARCLELCRDQYFPCYHYSQKGSTGHVSVMEQIAKVKLFYVPLALTKGVDVFMLDLDVGFVHDPNIMVKAFSETPIVDILVQEDYIFIMNRTKAGWKTWFTEPLPNIGLFLCRGNNRTARVFEIAWEKYLTMDDAYEKAQPGKDQNHVLEAMRIGRGTFGLKYAYFSNFTAPLMDKLVLNYGVGMELGGEVMQSFVMKHSSLAIHTTCYEKSTKTLGLKAANAFWNPRYYDSLRRTLTKPIIFLNEKQVQEEVRALLWLGIVTGRHVIIPNLIGSPDESSRRLPVHGDGGQGRVMLWPGFRVAKIRKELPRSLIGDVRISILEPAYYWRISRDYDEVPPAKILYFNRASDALLSIREQLMSEEWRDYPRIVLAPDLFHGQRDQRSEVAERLEKELVTWADDSLGVFRHTSFAELMTNYRPLPSLKNLRLKDGGDEHSLATTAKEVLTTVRNCAGIFDPPRGNRTCFQICK